MDGGAQADDEPVRGSEERGVHVDADRERPGAFGVGEQLRVTGPLIGFFVQDFGRGALVGARVERGDDRVFVRCLDRRRVDRLGQRAGHGPGHPGAAALVLHGPGRRPQRGHRFQA